MREVKSVGDRVMTDFGKGVITKVVQRLNRPWTEPEYYLVKLDKHSRPHMFAASELRKRYYFDFQAGERVRA